MANTTRRERGVSEDAGSSSNKLEEDVGEEAGSLHAVSSSFSNDKSSHHLQDKTASTTASATSTTTSTNGVIAGGGGRKAVHLAVKHSPGVVTANSESVEGEFYYLRSMLFKKLYMINVYSKLLVYSILA